MWHALSATPDDVTDTGIVVHADPGRRLQAEKQALRAAAHRLSHSHAPEQVRTLARLAASYLLAGDVETAMRYLAQAERMVEELTPEPPTGR
jgi:hypothetical protein